MLLKKCEIFSSLMSPRAATRPARRVAQWPRVCPVSGRVVTSAVYYFYYMW
jgi:hypothetical protein